MSVKPNRALIAYCALAQRLSQEGVTPTQALTPFFVQACKQFSGELFDASKFSRAVEEQFGLAIPKLAALGLTEQLAHEGLLEESSRTAGGNVVYRYKNLKDLPDDTLSSPVTEAEIELLLSSFVRFCRTDNRLQHKSDAELQAAFFDRLLNVESMRILSRREASISAKKTTNTLIKSHAPESPEARDSLHLDFLVGQFLLDQLEKNSAGFARISDIAFASMAAEAIACFREPSTTASPLTDLIVYLDAPLLLDILGVNTEYCDYGRDLLAAIKASGAIPAALDHSIAEAETAVAAQLAYLRSGINQLSKNWGTSAKPDLLNALMGNVGARVNKTYGISLERDPDTSLHKKHPQTVGNIETAMEDRMKAWRNVEAKEHDRKSVWSMIALRETAKPCSRICDSQKILLTRNTALVQIANTAWSTWLVGVTRHGAALIEQWSPIAMSDKQFAGYLWTRQGGAGDSTISKARLLAHCSAAVRPRADVKAKAINLALELSGREEADFVAALLEDREGSKALMRVTNGDPEDVTHERFPFILEQVKLAAGEFAAERVREESEKLLAEIEDGHKSEIGLLTLAASDRETMLKEQLKAKGDEILQHQQDKISLERSAESLKATLDEALHREQARVRAILEQGLKAGCTLYKTWRWIAVAMLALITGIVSFISSDSPVVGAILACIIGAIGFGYIPEFIEAALSKRAMAHLKLTVLDKDASITVPSSMPNFKEGLWPALDEELQEKA